MIRLRQINMWLLVRSGMVYRIIVISVNALFFYWGVKVALDKFGAIGASLIWNAINMCLYYLYHYTFAKLFRLGKEE